MARFHRQEWSIQTTGINKFLVVIYFYMASHIIIYCQILTLFSSYLFLILCFLRWSVEGVRRDSPWTGP